MPRPVTDPAILQQLEAPPQPVSDPALLAQLEQKPKPFGLADTWPARLAKSVWGGMTLPGDVYQGKVDPLSDEGIERSFDLAAVASPVKPRVASSMKSPVPGPPSADELKAAGSAGYDRARALGVDISPSSVQTSAQVLRANLEKDGINGELAPKTFSIISRLTQPPEGSIVTISNLETVRRTLGNAAKDFANPTEQLAAGKAIKHIDDYLANLGQGDVMAGDASQAAKILSEARGNYGAAKRSEQVTDAVRAAEFGAAAANSGRNIGNAERQKFKSILLSDKKSSGFNPEEIAQIEKVVQGTGPANSARYIGNLLGGGGGLGQAVTTGLSAMGGAAVGDIPGGIAGAMAVPAIGSSARALANKLTDRQIRKLDELVRSRSPLAESASMLLSETPNQQLRKSLMFRALLESQMQQR